MIGATLPAPQRRRIWISVAALVIVIALAFFLWRSWPGSGFVEYHVSPRTDIPAAIAVAPDGAVWFTLEMSDAIGVRRNGKIERLPKKTQNQEPLGLGVDADGSAWYTDAAIRAISRISPDGRIRSFPLTTPIVRLGRLAIGPDGAVWFADATTSTVTRLKDGIFTRHAPRSPDAAPWGVAIDAHGTVWATLQNVDRLARITGEGTVSEFEVPTRGSGLGDVAVDQHGAVWFLEQQANKIGRYADGQFTEFAIATPLPGLTAIAVAPDGSVWFTELRAGRLGRIRGGRVTEFRLPRNDARPFGVAVDRANNVWYTDLSGWLGMLRANEATGG